MPIPTCTKKKKRKEGRRLSAENYFYFFTGARNKSPTSDDANHSAEAATNLQFRTMPRLKKYSNFPSAAHKHHNFAATEVQG